MKTLRKGFTLIELLVVIAIIAIIATLIIVNLAQARTKSRDTRRIADLKQIQTALEMYADSNSNNYYYTATAIYSSAWGAFGTALTTGANPSIPAMPSDPKNVSPFVYGYISNPTSPATAYYLAARLEKDAGNVTQNDGGPAAATSKCYELANDFSVFATSPFASTTCTP